MCATAAAPVGRAVPEASDVEDEELGRLDASRCVKDVVGWDKFSLAMFVLGDSIGDLGLQGRPDFRV